MCLSVPLYLSYLVYKIFGIKVFIGIWEISNHYFFKYFFCNHSIPTSHPGLQMHIYETTW